MINAWKLLGEAARKPAWSNLGGGKKDIYDKGYSAAQSAPYGVSPAKTDYSGKMSKPSTGPMPTAGGSSWAQPGSGAKGGQQHGNR